MIGTKASHRLVAAMAVVLIPVGVALLGVAKPARDGPLILVGVVLTMVGVGSLVGAVVYWTRPRADGSGATARVRVDPALWVLIWLASLAVVGLTDPALSTLAPSGWPQTALRIGVFACWIPVASYVAARYG